MKSNKGSALLVAILLSAILLAALAGLLTVALNEYRGSQKSYLNTAAFSLAEAGVDRAAAAFKNESPSATEVTAWPSAESTAAPGKWYKKAVGVTTIYRGYFPVEDLEKGRKGVCAVTCIPNGSTSFQVYALGTIRSGSASNAIESQRAIKVAFTRTTTSGGGTTGCVARGAFTAASALSGVSATQKGASFDSYKSTGNAAPDSEKNRYRNAMMGTLSTKDNDLQLANSDLYCNISTGKSASPAAVGYAKDGTGIILTKVADDDASDDTCSTPTVAVKDEADLKNHIAHTLESTIEQPIPVSVASDYTQILPKNDPLDQNGQKSQWRQNGKPTDLPSTTRGVSCSGNTLNIGASDTSKYYTLFSTLDGIKTINVSGDAILVVTGNVANGDGLNINFLTPNAQIKIYVGSGINKPITSTQTINGAASQTNYEASRLTIHMMPTNNGISVSDMDAASVSTAVTTAIANGNLSGGTVNMNFDPNSIFTGFINAPYSTVSLSADANNKNKSHYCGALFANTIEVKGDNGFAFHFDEKLGNGGGGKSRLSVSTWKQILPSDFAAQL